MTQASDLEIPGYIRIISSFEKEGGTPAPSEPPTTGQLWPRGDWV